jgi:hypothetical protein
VAYWRDCWLDGNRAASQLIRLLRLRVCSHTRPGPVKSVTSPYPPSRVVFQLPALRTLYWTDWSKATM